MSHEDEFEVHETSPEDPSTDPRIDPRRRRPDRDHIRAQVQGHRDELRRIKHAMRDELRADVYEMVGRDGGHPRGRGRGRGRRGDIRAVLLTLLQDGPAHGYELIQAAGERSGGMWKPSPGSVYPTLQLLEDEGLLRSSERDGKRVYELTEAGATEASRLAADEATTMPWERQGASGGQELHKALAMLHLAVKQVSVAGSPELVEKATAVIQTARKSIYQLLAEE